MQKLIDLHTHTTASDGSMSPLELIRYAKKSGLSAIAITDHDTVAGIEDALNEGENLGIEVIPGIEISVDYNPEMHMLGYFTKDNYLNISGILADLKRNRDERNPKIINKLNNMGFNVSAEEVALEAGGNIIGRPHIAKVLLKKGYVKSIAEAFDKYLSSGKPAFFKKDKLSPEEGIKEIAKAGGVPVLAHPKHLHLTLGQIDELLSTLTKAGLRGIEAVYVDNTKDETGNFLRLAKKYKLLVTGGSDFHGNVKPEIDLGIGRGNLVIPYELLEILKKAYIMR